MKLKKIFLSLFSSTIIASPFIVSSCTLEAPNSEINREEQVDIITSEASKIVVLDTWLTTTFASLYSQYIYPGNDNQSIQDIQKIQNKISNSIIYYLENLVFPVPGTTGTINGNDTVVEFANIIEFPIEKENELKTLFQNAYKFYIQFKSTVPESEDLSPSLYFVKKSLEWKKEKYKTIIEIKDENNQILTIDNFNPSLDYSGVDAAGNIIENDFKILIATRGTKVFQEVMKLLLAEMYFLHATENQIKFGTNFNKLTKNPSSVNYINAMSYVEDKTTKDGQTHNDFSEYLLKKYTVENSPNLVWSYSGSDYTYQYTGPNKISQLNQFNSIKTTKETKLTPFLAPNSTEKENNSINKIEAFTSILLSNSSSDSEDSTLTLGDLAVNIDNIKTFGDSKIGLYDSSNNMLFSFSELEAIKQACQINSNNSSNRILLLPSINIKSDSQSKSSDQISIDDLSIEWQAGVSATFDVNNKSTYIANNYTQSLTINSISFYPSKIEDKSINISITYEFFQTNNSNTKYSFDYNFDISNWGNSSTVVSNPFSQINYFNQEPNSIGIEIFNDNGESTGISYYLRILPIFNKTGQIYIGNDVYMIGKFSFDKTPWNTEEQKRKLIYLLMLSDSNLYKTIQDFYLFNGYYLENVSSDLNSIINELGLSKKTDDDRKAQGII